MLGFLVLLLSACSSGPGKQPPALLEPYQPTPGDDGGRAEVRQTWLPEPLEANEFVLKDDEQRVVGQPQLVTLRWEDTFVDVARAYGLGYDELVAANPGIDPWIPGAGTRLLLPTQFILPDVPRSGVVLNLATRRLFYFPPRVEGEPIRVLTFPIGVGRVGWNTPLGRYSVISKQTDPYWTVPASVRREHAAEGKPLPAVVAPGPSNPLGRHALRLSNPSYLIHGTNKPAGVGMRVSHGCVRLFPENIEQLYEFVGVGVQVTIIDQPYQLAWHDGELYVEIHAVAEDDRLHPAQRLQELLLLAEAESGFFPGMSEEAQLLDIVNAASGLPVRLFREQSDQVVLRARQVRNVLAAEDWEENAAIWQ